MTLLLAGDIGGTKTLLSLYQASATGLECLAESRYPSADWPDLAPMVRAFLAGAAAPAAACFAVAGPVIHGQANITNLGWQLEECRLAEECGVARMELVNDFAVLVYGLPHLANSQLAAVRPGQVLAGAPLLVLGAGTGLGVALGVPTSNGLLALPTEGGHGTFAPRTEAEWRLSRWLQADLGVERLSIERVVSGTGLGAVGRWLLAERHPAGSGPAWAASMAGEEWPAVVARAAEAGDPLAREAR